MLVNLGKGIWATINHTERTFTDSAKLLPCFEIDGLERDRHLKSIDSVFMFAEVLF